MFERATSRERQSRAAGPSVGRKSVSESPGRGSLAGTPVAANPLWRQLAWQAPAPSSLEHVGSGAPLEPGVRGFFESRFGEGFGDVAFRAGEYSPDTQNLGGRRRIGGRRVGRGHRVHVAGHAAQPEGLLHEVRGRRRPAGRSRCVRHARRLQPGRRAVEPPHAGDSPHRHPVRGPAAGTTGSPARPLASAGRMRRAISSRRTAAR